MFSSKQAYKDTDQETLNNFLKQIYHYGFEDYQSSFNNPHYCGFSYRFDQPFDKEELEKLKIHYYHCVQKNGSERRVKALSDYASKMAGLTMIVNKDSSINELYNNPQNLGISLIQQTSYDGVNFINENYSPAFEK